MKIYILEEVEHDLLAGASFYDRLAQGLGDHFLETLYTEIDTLLVCAGIHIKVFGTQRRSQRGPFSQPSTYRAL